MVLKEVYRIQDKVKMISLDTSSTKTGWAYFENGEYVISDVINLNTKDLQKKYKGKSDDRIRDMCLNIINLCEKYKPDIVVIEKLNVGRNMNATRILSKIIGVVYGWTIINQCTYYEIQATEWRGKLGMQSSKRKREEYKQLSIDYIRNAIGKEVNDDEADSICAGFGYIKMFS